MDARLFTLINGLAGKIPFFDRFFQGISNDYFSLITICLIFVWMWFSTRERLQRERNQRGIIIALISMGIANALVLISNAFYFRIRPFNALPPGTVHLLYYKPHDSSFPSDFAATIFGLALPILFTNVKYGVVFVIIAVIGGFGRIYLGIHYPTDILGGIGFAVAGGLIAWGISKLFKPLFDFVMTLLQKVYLA